MERKSIRDVILSIGNRQLLYFLCFLAFELIDFLRNTQNGDIWSAAVGGTGLVMMVLIFSEYPLKEWHYGKHTRVYMAIWTVCCLGIAGGSALWQQHFILGIYKWTFFLGVWNVWWIFLVGQEIVKRLWKAGSLRAKPDLTGVLALVMAFLMTFSRSGRLWPVWFAAMFGMFYVTRFTREKLEQLFEAMVDATIVAFFVIQIYAYGFRPYDVIRYLGAYPNSNVASLHYLVVYTMVLCKLHYLEKKNAKRGLRIFFFLGAAGLLDFMFLTMGRTSWVTAIVITCFYGIFVIWKNWKKKFSGVIARGAALVAAFVVLFPVVFGTVRFLPAVLHHPVWYSGEYSIEKVHSFDPADSPKYIEMDEFLEAVFGRIVGTFYKGNTTQEDEAGNAESTENVAADNAVAGDNTGAVIVDNVAAGNVTGEASVAGNSTDNVVTVEAGTAEGKAGAGSADNTVAENTEDGENADRENAEQDNVNSAVTGDASQTSYEIIEKIGPEGMDEALNIRLSIYAAYLRNLNWFGHPDAEGHYQFADIDYFSWHAQNVWLQMAFSYGIPSGILFLILTVLLFRKNFLILKNAGNVPYKIIPFFICLLFFAYGLMELDWNVGQYPLILLFITQHPQIRKQQESN